MANHSGPITHAGLGVLILGALISCTTSYSGETQLEPGSTSPIKGAAWKLRVDDSWREDYPSGEPKQWFTHASVIGERGNVIRQETICVNAPMSFDGFDVYQAAWGPHKANLSFNGHKQSVVLRPMGNTNVGVLPVAPRVLLVLSVKRRDMPMDVYVKTGANRAPQMVASLNVGDEFKMGAVSMRYEQFVPSTHLKYKHDPGVPVVYLGFALITCGACMAAFEKSSKALEANVV